MGIIIWLLFYRKHSTKLNKTTKFTTENFLLWYGLWNSGDTIYKARATPQLSTQTIRTLHILDQHRSLIGNKLDGRCISQNLMWNWSINWDRRWFNQMPCPTDLTSFRNMTQIMRTWHSYPNICFWIYSISPCRIESWTWDESTISWRFLLHHWSTFWYPWQLEVGNDWRKEHVVLQGPKLYSGQYGPATDILGMLHDHETAGHPGEVETLASVECHYWWPGLRTFVQNYVKGCSMCQQYKINWSPFHPSYMPILASTGTWPFAHCSMDLITDLPLSDGFNSILVMVDHGLMKGVLLLPCSKTITTKQVANLLLEHLYKRFGLPDEFISNRGP